LNIGEILDTRYSAYCHPNANFEFRLFSPI
jgi:hypothetical protein